MELFPYQREGVEFLKSHPLAFLADEPGLGKTVQTLQLINETEEIRKVLVVSPASVKSVWRAEWEKVMNRPLSVAVVQAGKEPRWDADIVVINYDIMDRYHDTLTSIKWDLIVLDEAHYIKNPNTKRAKCLVGSKAQKKKALVAKRQIAVSGTPIVNRPMELYTLLHWLRFKGLPSMVSYGMRYCAGYKDDRGQFVYKGATRLDELHTVLKKKMLRRRKADVLPQLPPKIRQVVPFEFKEGAKEMEAFGYPKTIEDALSALRPGAPNAESLSTLRAELAQKRVPYVIDFLETKLNEVDKLVVFCHHKATVKAIVDAFPGISVSITGDTPVSKRAGIVEQFQKDPSKMLFVGNVQAAGTGITLTASSNVVFAELVWVPGDLLQAEDRCYRIGTVDNVLVQYLVAEDGLDAFMLKIILKKMRIIEKVLDGNAHFC